jgi:hypothetical protein
MQHFVRRRRDSIGHDGEQRFTLFPVLGTAGRSACMLLGDPTPRRGMLLRCAGQSRFGGECLSQVVSRTPLLRRPSRWDAPPGSIPCCCSPRPGALRSLPPHTTSILRQSNEKSYHRRGPCTHSGLFGNDNPVSHRFRAVCIGGYSVLFARFCWQRVRTSSRCLWAQPRARRYRRLRWRTRTC